MATQAETLTDYKPLHQQMTKDQFIEQYQCPFLVQDLKAKSSEEEKNFEFATIQITREDLESPSGRSPQDVLATPVYRIAKRGANVFEGMINVGRAGNNDIVLDFQSVSKFHAYVTKDPVSQSYCLTDADSTNGSFVNGTRLKPHQKTPLGEADTICFAGQVDLKYYSAGGFYDVLSLLSG